MGIFRLVWRRSAKDDLWPIEILEILATPQRRLMEMNAARDRIQKTPSRVLPPCRDVRDRRIMRHLFAAVLIVVLSPPSSFAAGSFTIEDILPLLQQNKELNEFIISTLDIDSGGWATRIGSRANEGLSGARIAPYSIRAKPKGSRGPWLFYLEIGANTEFLDDQGKPVPLEQGKSIKETLIGVRLVPIPESQGK